MTPVDRFADAKEIGDMVVMMLSDNVSSFMTGHDLVMDGGKPSTQGQDSWLIMTKATPHSNGIRNAMHGHVGMRYMCGCL